MCVIYSCYEKTPSREELANGAESNTDGAGICWIKNFNTPKAATVWVKGLKSTPDAVLEAIEKHKITYPFGIHYRTASIGGKCDELTHPFPITDDLEDSTEGSARRVLMHNGHIADWKEWFTKIMFASAMEIPVGPWSDSRALAAAVNIKGEGVIDFVIGTSRVMVLDSLASRGFPKDKPISYIRLYGNWIHKEGYDQSVETTPRRAVQSVDGWRHGRRGVYSSHKSCEVHESSSRVVTSGENNWSVDELESLISEIRKEQDEARVYLGC